MKVMFVKATRQTEAGQVPTKEAILAMHKLNEELEKAGVLLDLGGLTPTGRGVRVYRGSKRTVIATALVVSAFAAACGSSANAPTAAMPAAADPVLGKRLDAVIDKALAERQAVVTRPWGWTSRTLSTRRARSRAGPPPPIFPSGLPGAVGLAQASCAPCLA